MANAEFNESGDEAAQPTWNRLDYRNRIVFQLILVGRFFAVSFGREYRPGMLWPEAVAKNPEKSGAYA